MNYIQKVYPGKGIKIKGRGTPQEPYVIEIDAEFEEGEVPSINSNGNWQIGGNDTGVKAEGPKGDKGDVGESAYEAWLKAGNNGTKEDFLNYLKGDKGDKGDDGALAGVTLPTSDPGDGVSIWNDGGVLKVATGGPA